MNKIQIRTLKGIRSVKGFIVGPFGVHERHDAKGQYTITHLATGMCVPFSFASVEAAQAAAKEWARLKNYWSDLDTAIMFTPEFALMSAELMMKHGGTRTSGPTKKRYVFKRALNGQEVIA